MDFHFQSRFHSHDSILIKQSVTKKGMTFAPSSPGAQDQSRTDMPFLALPPESSASTNFATCASKVTAKIRKIFQIATFTMKISAKYLSKCINAEIHRRVSS